MANAARPDCYFWNFYPGTLSLVTTKSLEHTYREIRGRADSIHKVPVS